MTTPRPDFNFAGNITKIVLLLYILTFCIILFVVYLGFCEELRERLGVDDIALVLQQNRLRWYGHVLRKDDEDWVKKLSLIHI